MTDLELHRADAPLVLVGAGKMGGAMLRGWLAGGAPAEGIIVVEPSEDRRAAVASANPGLTCVADRVNLPEGVIPRAIVLAVKPQMFDSVLPTYRHLGRPGVLIVSIAAGKTTAGLRRYFGDGAEIVRAMPNTPSAIGAGMTVLYAEANVGAANRDLADTLVGAVGQSAWIEDEALMDAVTAVSGSGPAYVFHLTEALAEAGKQAGLPADMAERLARQTVVGSGALMARDRSSAATLRQNVTSPGGTTEAALGVLMEEDALQQLMVRAVRAAVDRSRELAD